MINRFSFAPIRSSSKLRYNIKQSYNSMYSPFPEHECSDQKGKLRHRGKELEQSNYFLIREKRFNVCHSVSLPRKSTTSRSTRKLRASRINSKKVEGDEDEREEKNEKAGMKQKGAETRLEESTTENGGW